MTVFKTYLKILNKNKIVIIIYTILLLVFGSFRMGNSSSSMDFSATKPDILVINNDTNGDISKDLVSYLEKNCNIKNIDINEDSINDALFYRDIKYVIYIPNNYTNDFMDGKNPAIDIKSTGDYQSSLAEMIIKRYIRNADTYRKYNYSEEQIIKNVNKNLENSTNVVVNTKLDTKTLYRTSFYFTFASYSIIACLIYVISLITNIFNDAKIKKRTLISSSNYRKINNNLFLSNCIYSLLVWLFYVIMGFTLLGKVMLSNHGLLFIFNSFIFTVSATSLAFMIGNIISKKEAITGIMNVVAIGSSFLCGAFVPQEILPSSVLKMGQFLPTYYYITNNNYIQNLEIFNFDKLYPIFINMFIMLGFAIGFIIATNIITRYKRKIG